jgi:hypothetical protein
MIYILRLDLAYYARTSGRSAALAQPFCLIHESRIRVSLFWLCLSVGQEKDIDGARVMSGVRVRGALDQDIVGEKTQNVGSRNTLVARSVDGDHRHEGDCCRTDVWFFSETGLESLSSSVVVSSRTLRS